MTPEDHNPEMDQQVEIQEALRLYYQQRNEAQFSIRGNFRYYHGDEHENMGEGKSWPADAVKIYNPVRRHTEVFCSQTDDRGSYIGYGLSTDQTFRLMEESGDYRRYASFDKGGGVEDIILALLQRNGLLEYLKNKKIPFLLTYEQGANHNTFMIVHIQEKEAVKAGLYVEPDLYERMRSEIQCPSEDRFGFQPKGIYFYTGERGLQRRFTRESALFNWKTGKKEMYSSGLQIRQNEMECVHALNVQWLAENPGYELETSIPAMPLDHFGTHYPKQLQAQGVPFMLLLDNNGFVHVYVRKYPENFDTALQSTRDTIHLNILGMMDNVNFLNSLRRS